MTDRTHTLTVILEKPIRVDDAEGIVDAIKRIRGVATVGVNIADPNTYYAVAFAKHDIKMKLFAIVGDE